LVNTLFATTILGYRATTMAFEACLCTATSPHHLVLSSSTVARLPRYDEGGGSQGFRATTTPSYWHCPLGLQLQLQG
ncbi:hypothetical protein EDD85DRAFT_827342, partial [Armillaria nabsnona]